MHFSANYPKQFPCQICITAFHNLHSDRTRPALRQTSDYDDDYDDGSPDADTSCYWPVVIRLIQTTRPRMPEPL